MWKRTSLYLIRQSVWNNFWTTPLNFDFLKYTNNVCELSSFVEKLSQSNDSDTLQIKQTRPHSQLLTWLAIFLLSEQKIIRISLRLRARYTHILYTIFYHHCQKHQRYHWYNIIDWKIVVIIDLLNIISRFKRVSIFFSIFQSELWVLFSAKVSCHWNQMHF